MRSIIYRMNCCKLEVVISGYQPKGREKVICPHCKIEAKPIRITPERRIVERQPDEPTHSQLPTGNLSEGLRPYDDMNHPFEPDKPKRPHSLPNVLGIFDGTTDYLTNWDVSEVTIH